MSRFAEWQSRTLGALAERLVVATGGRCEDVTDMRVCRCGRIRWYGRGGTQWGDCFVTAGDAAAPGRALLAHERHHRDAQWRRHGWAFGLMYVAAECWDVWLRRRPCNRYERAAEDASDGGGGYPPEPPR
ncbi:hypothetical protein LX16_2217 [Stackebrandtia albiflava]|uniref:Uncharacterized protein n=1 Tax=Stackebrandtia albiflava TaxID=406432 RepID=A0A562V0X6_9ACTN|nr:hypothetical protein [Stackebrandtia albiflava]TWJ11495.1 hypothetical protein LX16_2217 [Stackebrandtia albiflava]